MATVKQEELPLVLLRRPPNFHFPFKDRLQTHFRLLDPLDSDPPESTHSFFSRHAASVHVLLCVDPTPVTRGLLSLLPFLQLIVGSSTGVDHIDLQECRRRSISVTNAGKAFSPDVADLAVGLLIDVLRRVSAGCQYVRAGLWAQNGEFPLGFKLGGKRVGIVGLGSIGAEIAKRLEPFGCSISYNSRRKKPSVPFPWFKNVYDLAVNNDVLIVCCTLTEESRHIISKDVMTALGTEGVIINVGRGALIDEKELVQLLVRGELRGAGLDVFENEPDVPQELFSLKNVVLSPHCAVATPECFDALEELITANLHAFFSSKPLQSVVELE
ncbi:glyoxylate/hydroxypyruvate reductase HPR3-like [Gossypium arboreum]|nr:glyoxylate/hydroxypyruvate reductase HPR3-like [Gossypium arboreum]